ncbi:hypothetical protein MRX96_036858 [Rhipicephalus microplus]
MDSAEPQKGQASQSRLTKPAKKYDQNYPLLLLQNRFSVLQDSTPDPQPELRPRSGSLPGYTMKRPTPPPPKPKTPGYLHALLTQKPPTPSEGPSQAAKAASVGQGQTIFNCTGSQCHETT